MPLTVEKFFTVPKSELNKKGIACLKYECTICKAEVRVSIKTKSNLNTHMQVSEINSFILLINKCYNIWAFIFKI